MQEFEFIKHLLGSIITWQESMGHSDCEGILLLTEMYFMNTFLP
jgi:hypothetical protein